MEAEVTQALEAPYREAGEAVREANAKNIDETSWKDRKRRAWLWGAATNAIAFFVIHASRGYSGLKALVGNVFRGVFSSDRWVAYTLRALRFRQLCWAHLVRDFQTLVDMGGEARKLGERAKELAGELFLIWNDFKKGMIDRPTLRRTMRPVRKDVSGEPPGPRAGAHSGEGCSRASEHSAPQASGAPDFRRGS